MIPAQNREQFDKEYTGDPAFKEEAFQWYLIGRIDGMMSNLKQSQEHLERKR